MRVGMEKIPFIKGKLKALPPAIAFAVVLFLLLYYFVTAITIWGTMISVLLVMLWIMLGISALWVFIPQWDPWLRKMRGEFYGRRVVALTFDDGPTEPWTSRVLDILKERGVKATFFVVGEHAKGNPALVKRAYDEGHTVGCHTATHRILTFMKPAERLSEIESGAKAVEEISGRRPKYIRLPHGFKFPGMHLKLKQLDLVPIPWTKGVWDTDMPPADELLRRVKRDMKPFEVLLLHDGITGDRPDATRRSLVEALPRIVDEYRRRGYEFKTIAELEEACGS
jgi:peptidoglycan/xylan/chitin deacetylase (PgdA/CDA1 family)